MHDSVPSITGVAMNNVSTVLKVHRSVSQYALSFAWLLFGLVVLYLSLLGKLNFNYVTLAFLTIGFLHACNLVLMYHRPLIKIEAEYFTAYPNIFKKIAVRVNAIKGIKLYEVTKKTILTQNQVKQNNTLILDLVDGTSISLQLSWLTKSARQSITTLAKERNMSFQYQMPNNV
jgi:hypothetical protein